MEELRYRALLIGNNWYNDDELSDIEGPERDVAAMKAALTDHGWGLFSHDNVRVLYGRPESELRREIGSFFVDSTPHDVLLLYFSGHGMQYFNELFLCAEDTEVWNLRATAIGASFINDLADHASTQRVVVLLDCCDSGLFKGPLDYTGLRGRGRFILTSTFGPGKSRNASGGGLSPFTEHLLRALTGAAVAEDGWVRFKSVAAYVCANVHAETGQEASSRGHDSGDLALARCGGIPASATPDAGQASTQPHSDKRPVSFAWPATPTADRVTAAIEQWAAAQRLVPRRPVRRVKAIRPASTLRLTVVKVTEERTEHERERPAAERRPVNQYVGPIVDAVTPIDKGDDLWSTKTYEGWRRGSDSTDACGRCVNGLVRCRECNGRGSIKSKNRTAPPNPGHPIVEQVPCDKCNGDRKRECGRCRGCGQMRKYKFGKVTRVRTDTNVLATQEEPARQQVPYRPIGTIESLEGAWLPTAIRRKVDAIVAEQRRPLSPDVKRMRIELAFLLEIAVDFDDGSAIRHARLVGDDLEIHLPGRELFAIRVRRLGIAIWDVVRMARTRPVAAAGIVAASAVLVLLRGLLKT
jgi:hypothetical protein